MIEAPSKAEAVRQLAMRDPSLGGTLGQRENDELFKELLATGGKTFTVNTQEAKAMLAKIKSDPRLKLQGMSIRELEAKIRRMELQEKVEANQKQIEQEEAEYEELLHTWRDLPQIPTSKVIDSALRLREYEPDLLPPGPPDWDLEKKSLLNYVASDLKSKFPYWLVPLFIVKRKAKKIANMIWPNKETEVLIRYQKAVKEHKFELVQRKVKWNEQENGRIARLNRLITGDLAEMHNTAVEAFESIVFPFDTSCDVCLDEPSVLFINLDLPEIEDVIPSHKKKASKNGEIAEIKIDQTIRNRDYFGLVIGQAILIAAHIFADLPPLRYVRIAGYTQRQRKKASDEIDTYLFDVEFPKDFIANLNTNADDLRPLVKALSPIMSIKNTWELEKVAPPSWLQA